MREIHPPGDARVHLYPQEVSVLVVVQHGGRCDLLGAVDGSVGYLREGKVERVGVRIVAHSQTMTPSKVQGRDSSKDTPARPVRRATGWPACGLRRLYHILMGAPELERAEPRSVAEGAQKGTQRLWRRRIFGGED